MKLDHLLCERLPFFSKLSYEQKIRLCQYVKYEKHSKGVQLFTQGSEAGYIYYVLTGQIQLISKNIENAEIVVDYYNIGSLLNPNNLDGTWEEHSLRKSSAFLNADSEFLSFDRSRLTTIGNTNSF
jgi:CRP-like cAMP-binding protein